MAEKNRHLQVIRSKKNYTTNSEAKEALSTVLGTLGNGELAISTYQDSNAVDGVANILGIKAQGKKFYIDDQHVLNVLGLDKPSKETGDYTLNLDNVTDVTNKLVFGKDTEKAKTIQEALNKLASYASNLKQEALGSGAVNNIERKVSDTGVYTGASKGSPSDTGSVTTDKYIITKKVLENNELKDKKEALTLMYTSASPVELEMPIDFGDLKKGTKAEDLNKMSLSEVLDAMLFKTIYPTVTNPTLTASVTRATPDDNTISTGNTVSKITHKYNRGTVKVEAPGIEDKSYAGTATTVSYSYSFAPGEFEPKGTAVSKTTFPEGGVIMNQIGTYTFYVDLEYAVGEAFTDSKGNATNPMTLATGGSVTNPKPSGSISASTMVSTTVPWFANTGATYTSELKNMGSTPAKGTVKKDVRFGVLANSNQIIIDSVREISSVIVKDAFGNYTNSGKVNGSTTNINKTINGISVPYKRWTSAQTTSFTSSSLFQITFKN